MRMMAAAVLTVGLALAASPARSAEDPAGTWRMANGKVTVRVSHCGSRICGRIVGLKKPRDSEGRPKLDKENPNPSLRQRPVIGLTILTNMKSSGDGRWSGMIYNPDDGNSYSSYLQVTGHSTMKVSGCVAGVLCKSVKFNRVD